VLTTNGESIDAHEGGGSSRSSDEDAVMALERRGCGAACTTDMANQQWEEPPGLCVASESKGIVERAARSRMSREVHVRSLWGTGGEIPPVYPANFDAKRRSHKWKNHEGESTNAEFRGGLPCISDEAE
jgi:hypothetical protein